MNVTRFEKVDLEKQFYFIGFEEQEIEKTLFIKVFVLDKSSNTTFTIYLKHNDDIYDKITDLDTFENIDDKINVVYKNGHLRFNLELSR